MARPGFLVAIAHVDPDIRVEFERWYNDHHLPQAAHLLRASHAYRMHGEGDAHVAVYRVDDLDRLDEPDPNGVLASLISEFNTRWPIGVSRRRYYLDLVQELALD